MKFAVNVGELKNRLSEYLARVENEDEIEVCKRNIPFATITGKPLRKNRSQPGFDTSIKILGPITGPIIPEEDWNMLRDDFDLDKKESFTNYWPFTASELALYLITQNNVIAAVEVGSKSANEVIMETVISCFKHEKETFGFGGNVIFLKNKK